ncbi:hypothetical protein BSNK01_01830 [Bacillaceae bacterium]
MEDVHLYRIEVELANDERYVAVLLAETDEEAFAAAEKQIDMELLGGYEIRELVMVQRLPARNGTGFIVRSRGDAGAAVS